MIYQKYTNSDRLPNLIVRQKFNITTSQHFAKFKLWLKRLPDLISPPMQANERLRTKNYRAALKLWSEWKEKDFVARMRALISGTSG
jgi:hypothetical protein